MVERISWNSLWKNENFLMRVSVLWTAFWRIWNKFISSLLWTISQFRGALDEIFHKICKSVRIIRFSIIQETRDVNTFLVFNVNHVIYFLIWISKGMTSDSYLEMPYLYCWSSNYFEMHFEAFVFTTHKEKNS